MSFRKAQILHCFIGQLCLIHHLAIIRDLIDVSALISMPLATVGLENRISGCSNR
jgi:hypothetical protein